MTARCLGFPSQAVFIFEEMVGFFAGISFALSANLSVHSLSGEMPGQMLW